MEKCAFTPPKRTMATHENRRPVRITEAPGDAAAGATASRLGAGTMWWGLPDGSDAFAETGWHVEQAVERPECGAWTKVAPPRTWQVDVQPASVRAQSMSCPGV